MRAARGAWAYQASRAREDRRRPAMPAGWGPRTRRPATAWSCCCRRRATLLALSAAAAAHGSAAERDAPRAAAATAARLLLLNSYVNSVHRAVTSVEDEHHYWRRGNCGVRRANRQGRQWRGQRRRRQAAAAGDSVAFEPTKGSKGDAVAAAEGRRGRGGGGGRPPQCRGRQHAPVSSTQTTQLDEGVDTERAVAPPTPSFTWYKALRGDVQPEARSKAGSTMRTAGAKADEARPAPRPRPPPPPRRATRASTASSSA